jgi:acetyl-CoA carboxylase carboxyl transferase subunit alpha
MGFESVLDFERPLIELEKKIEELRAVMDKDGVNLKNELEALQNRADELKHTIYKDLTPWQRVLVARHPKRPYSLDYIGMIFTDFIEVHGDRQFADDPAIVCGLAKISGRPVMVIAQQKGRDTKENIMRNFGMMNPEGYRKAMRVMKMAEKFHRAVIILIDTPGAYPGIGAEERGQAEAIARNLRDMSMLRTPTIATIIGEGGSGGALGIGVTDRVLMLENSIYSVISPEGCASILWRSAKHAPEAAAALKITSKDLKELGVIDDIIPEPAGGAHRNPVGTAGSIKNALLTNLAALDALNMQEMLDRRYEKFRAMGRFMEAAN